MKIVNSYDFRSFHNKIKLGVIDTCINIYIPPHIHITLLRVSKVTNYFFCLPVNDTRISGI